MRDLESGSGALDMTDGDTTDNILGTGIITNASLAMPDASPITNASPPITDMDASLATNASPPIADMGTSLATNTSPCITDASAITNAPQPLGNNYSDIPYDPLLENADPSAFDPYPFATNLDLILALKELEFTFRVMRDFMNEGSIMTNHELKHAALHGARHYDEAIDAFQLMLSKLDNTPDTQVRVLCQQYISLSEAEGVVQQIIHAQLDNAPNRLFNTSTGRLCGQQVQINAFTSSMEYKELLSSMMKHGGIQVEWEGKEPLLHDIQDTIVYDLNPVGGIAKVQSFCITTRDMGHHWAWIDTCCIDQTNNVELQQSVNSMFIWYHHSALTIIYLSDVPPSSIPGALAGSAWNTRGWTVQEFLAPNIVLFYQRDWSLYLDDHSPNHKDSIAIMQEMGDATGIDARALVAFRPGMRGAREKLQWASKRVTTWQEDIAYSLFGIFGINLPVIYGEKKQKVLGRLLQEVVAQLGDISALDWVGESSEFNSCLPANITSYTAPLCTLPSLSEDEIQTLVSLLQNTKAMESASKLYTLLDHMSTPHFTNCRLHLPCISFHVMAETFLLVHLWDCDLLELPDFVELSGLAGLPDIEDNMQSEGYYWSAPGSPLQDSLDRSLEAQELPFGAFLLVQQHGREYKRIVSDHAIIAQVNDLALLRT
ncbi:hypothetical protein BDR05DRAFT_1004146 [Suillus weaverae]|nr:hypothetical protein BDR05DRAFT_1004146 [Suillus weaverae]